MRNRYKIPEIRAVQLLGCMTEEAFTKQLPEFNTADASHEGFMKWTMQDECPMFHLAESILRERADSVNPAFREDDLSRVFVYMDFAGIFDRQPVSKIDELQKKAELMFRPEGIPLMIAWKPARYIAFERSASMSRNSKLCFVREDMYGELRRRMMLDMTIGHCQLSKLYAYNGLLFTGGRRIDSRSLLNERRIIVVDNPKTIIPKVKTITVEDDGTKELIRRCQNRLELFIAMEQVHPHELVKYAEALGKRDFALTIMPSSVLATALDRRGLFDEPAKKKKKRRWFWRV